jgi:hypothetical protein
VLAIVPCTEAEMPRFIDINTIKFNAVNSCINVFQGIWNHGLGVLCNEWYASPYSNEYSMDVSEIVYSRVMLLTDAWPQPPLSQEPAS